MKKSISSRPELKTTDNSIEYKRLHHLG